MRATDHALVGRLLLHRGRWGGRQVLSKEWWERSVTPSPRNPDYGLLWWLMPLDGVSPSGGRDDTIWMASGNFNNWIFIVPKHDLVIVVTGGDNRSFGAPVDFLYREILPAVVLP